MVILLLLASKDVPLELSQRAALVIATIVRSRIPCVFNSFITRPNCSSMRATIP